MQNDECEISPGTI